MRASNCMQGLKLWITFLTLAIPPGIQSVCRRAKRLICGPLWRFLKWFSWMSISASGDVSEIIMGNFLSSLYGKFVRWPTTWMTLLSSSKNGERLSGWQFLLIQWLDDSSGRFEVESSGVVDPFIYLNSGRKLLNDAVKGYSRWAEIWWGKLMTNINLSLCCDVLLLFNCW